ncbi:delta(3,5)-Delta(2,4)-dienoyl-CoA isomerase, mitochondrial-like [Phalacrocorax aristotelis]|uniref:delta(3,5)-Delta(2,4)-dienoyl-CoA isomerase, mitochondrial-like n=1 Tax=Phalacrocorax aristotelis TaxID=126867 RepID=UPI003F4B88E8
MSLEPLGHPHGPSRIPVSPRVSPHMSPRVSPHVSPCPQEVDIGLAADVGTLQRLPKIVGSQSLVNELAFTARKMMAPEAQSCGLVSRVFPDKATLLQGALDVAAAVAARSPVAVQGTKVNLLYSRDHPVPESLRYMATWNMSMLQTDDILKSVQAAMEKKGPEDVPFSKL